MRSRISGTGSMPSVRESRLDPRRKAVLTSKDLIVQALLAHSCNNNDLVSLCIVGESLGMSSIFGS